VIKIYPILGLSVPAAMVSLIGVAMVSLIGLAMVSLIGVAMVSLIGVVGVRPPAVQNRNIICI
jgi:hypothetical protein